MIEIELIKKLVEAHTMWVTPPYYTNDAQDVIKELVNLAVDTEWEKGLQEILEPEFALASLESLEQTFLATHSDYTKENLQDVNHRANSEYHGYLQGIDRQENERIQYIMERYIREIGESVSDKVHRQNLQIADLKKQLAEGR